MLRLALWPLATTLTMMTITTWFWGVAACCHVLASSTVGTEAAEAAMAG